MRFRDQEKTGGYVQLASALHCMSLVICSVAGTARNTLMAKLMQEYPTKFGTAIRFV